MRFLLDENFRRAAKFLLEGLGHEVLDTRLMGMSGQDDRLASFLSDIAEKQFPGTAFELRDRAWVAFPSINDRPKGRAESKPGSRE